MYICVYIQKCTYAYVPIHVHAQYIHGTHAHWTQTCIHTSTHTPHTWERACKHEFVYLYINACKHACIPIYLTTKQTHTTCIHACMHTIMTYHPHTYSTYTPYSMHAKNTCAASSLETCIHTWVNITVYTYMNTYVRACLHKYANIHEQRYLSSTTYDFLLGEHSDLELAV